MEEEIKQQKRKVTNRFNIIFFLIFILFVTLILRLAFLQLVEGDNYIRASQDLSNKSLYISAPRGWIFDRNGEILVDNKPVYTITFLEERHSKDDLSEVAINLEKLLMPIDPSYNRAKILEKMDADYKYVSKDGIEELLSTDNDVVTFNPDHWELKANQNKKMPSFYPRRIMEDVPKEVLFYVAEHRTELRGVEVIIEPKRQYKKGAFATHILGYTNAISPDKLDEYLAKGYRADDRIGVAGLEDYYESELRGKEGVRQVQVNSQAKTIETKEILQAQRGNDLVLTIDWTFQKKLEDIIEDELKHLRTREKDPVPEANKAVAILMNPKTGEIYGMVNHPQYDLNVHNSPDYGKRYMDEVYGREQNFIISGFYEPGSTFKMLSVLIGLEENLITANEQYRSTGTYEVGNMVKRDWRRGGHGNVNARKALQDSVNTYMFEIAMRLANYPNSKTQWREMFSVLENYTNQFGLGVKTGIDLPRENRGLFNPDIELGRLADAFIGQYHKYTPIQMAQYVSTIANGGYRVQPYLVKEIREPGDTMEEMGKLIWAHEPVILNKVDVDPKHLKVVQEGMYDVVHGGTAKSVFKDFPYTVAAKTGTAQIAGRTDSALIVGYAPYEDPEVTFIVVVPEGGGGSATAGPIARRLLDAYFGVEPLQETDATS